MKLSIDSRREIRFMDSLNSTVDQLPVDANGPTNMTLKRLNIPIADVENERLAAIFIPINRNLHWFDITVLLDYVNRVVYLIFRDSLFPGHKGQQFLKSVQR